MAALHWSAVLIPGRRHILTLTQVWALASCQQDPTETNDRTNQLLSANSSENANGISDEQLEGYENSQRSTSALTNTNGTGESAPSGGATPSQTCTSNGDSIALSFFPTTLPYNYNVVVKAPLPTGSAVRLFPVTAAFRAMWFNQDGTESAYHKAVRDYYVGFPGIDPSSLKGWELACYNSRGSGMGQFSPTIIFGPPRANEPANTTNLNTFPFLWRGSGNDTNLDILACYDLCPGCNGGTATSLSDYVDFEYKELALYRAGCGIKAINGDGISDDLKVTLQDTTFKTYPQISTLGSPPKDDTTWRLKEIRSGFDTLGCTIREQKLIAEYKGPNTDKCPCKPNVPCTAKAPKDPETLACRRVEELNPSNYAPELTLGNQSPSDWIPFNSTSVTDSNGTHTVFSGNGLSINVKIDIGDAKEKIKEYLAKLYDSQQASHCFTGPMGATQGSCGSAKLSKADIQDAIDRMESCALWNMPKTISLGLQNANFLGGIFTFGVNDSSPVKTCEWGSPLYKARYGSDFNNYQPGESQGFVGYASHGIYEVRPSGNLTITTKGDITGGVGFTLYKVKNLETYVQGPFSSVRDLPFAPYSPLFVGMGAGISKAKYADPLKITLGGSNSITPNYKYGDIPSIGPIFDAKISFAGFP